MARNRLAALLGVAAFIPCGHASAAEGDTKLADIIVTGRATGPYRHRRRSVRGRHRQGRSRGPADPARRPNCSKSFRVHRHPAFGVAARPTSISCAALTSTMVPTSRSSTTGWPINMRTHGHGRAISTSISSSPNSSTASPSRRVRTAPRTVTSPPPAQRASKPSTRSTRRSSRQRLGPNDYYRLVAAGSFKAGEGDLLLGGEARYDNGPFDLPEDLKLFSGLVKLDRAAGGRHAAR